MFHKRKIYPTLVAVVERLYLGRRYSIRVYQHLCTLTSSILVLE